MTAQNGTCLPAKTEAKHRPGQQRRWLHRTAAMSAPATIGPTPPPSASPSLGFESRSETAASEDSSSQWYTSHNEPNGRTGSSHKNGNNVYSDIFKLYENKCIRSLQRTMGSKRSEQEHRQDSRWNILCQQAWLAVCVYLCRKVWCKFLSSDEGKSWRLRVDCVTQSYVSVWQRTKTTRSWTFRSPIIFQDGANCWTSRCWRTGWRDLMLSFNTRQVMKLEAFRKTYWCANMR